MHFTDLAHGASVFLRAVNASSTASTSNSTGVTTSSVIPGSTVANTILVVAADNPSAQAVTLGLDGYGIPHQELYVPQAGTALPSLNDTATQGNFGGIVVVSEVGYQYSTGWFSALTADQWNTMYNYQVNFGVRMVRLNVYPGPDFGATTAIAGAGCCDTGVEQLLSITDASTFPTANIKTNAPVSTEGLWHYPALITNSSMAKEIAQFAPSGSFTNTTTAAVINDFGTRQQMVWFISWAPDWSATSSYLQHSYIHWMTRGIFVGKRKVYLNTQVDDVHLETDIYYPNGTTFRIRPEDLDALVPWMANLNTRLPAGSNYIMELGHNGNGNIENATDDSRGENLCKPDEAVEYDSPPDTPLEWIKPLGTGTNLWDPMWISYNWSLSCAKIDALASWFTVPANLNAFSHVSHTFTHEEVDNATYYDCVREIAWNRAWLKEVGIDQATRYSTNGLIPPAITGLHNGDALQAWTDNGIKYVVGDNTRPVLRNPNSTFWPLYSNVAENGFDGMVIVPRWATTIYYNCWSPDCTLLEWINTSTAASGNFTDLLANALATNTRYLLGLQPDPYMFHQANLRNIDMPEFTVGDQTAKFSLIQIWVETIAQEMIRLTNWPITSLKHDDIATLFLNRMTLDTTCNPNLSYQISADGTAITAVTVTTTNNVCSVPVPVTLAQTATTTGSATSDLVGSEPLIMWATMNGSPVTFTFSTPVPL